MYFHAAKEVNSTEKTLVKQLPILVEVLRSTERDKLMLLPPFQVVALPICFISETNGHGGYRTGIFESEASQIVQQTIFGSAQLWLHSGESQDATATSNIAWWNTAAAIEKFNDLKLSLGIQQGIHQAFLRAVELSKP